MRNLWDKMNQNFKIFMQGRNGMDEFARAESVLTIVVMLIAMLFFKLPLVQSGFCVLIMALIIHQYFRIFSRNLNKRYAENQWFLNLRYKAIAKAYKKKEESKQKQNYKYFRCPDCKQRVRVPRGHGKIQITCPKCRKQFIKRT